MITDAVIAYFCPNCWREIYRDTVRCPDCGYNTTEYSQLPYEERMILALNHPIRENRLAATQILGNLRSRAALPRFQAMLESESDFYLLRAVLIAVAKIGSREVLSEAMKHESSHVRELAARLTSSRGQE